MFQKATKKAAKGRIALCGPSGAGKTRSALSIAEHLLEPDQRIAVIDTEAGSASKYSDLHDFDVLEMSGKFEPSALLEAVRSAEKAGYGVVIVDSATSFWKGAGGFLSMIDAEAKKAAARGGKFDTFSAWKIVDPIYMQWVQALWETKVHIIFCIRSKMSYEKDETTKKIQKVGYAPEFREDFTYTVDVELNIDADHNGIVAKTRCDALDGKLFHKPGAEFAAIYKEWLSKGAPATPKVDPIATLLAKAEAITDKASYDAVVEEYRAMKPNLTAEQSATLTRTIKAHAPATNGQ